MLLEQTIECSCEYACHRHLNFRSWYYIQSNKIILKIFTHYGVIYNYMVQRCLNLMEMVIPFSVNPCLTQMVEHYHRNLNFNNQYCFLSFKLNSKDFNTSWHKSQWSVSQMSKLCKDFPIFLLEKIVEHSQASCFPLISKSQK